MKNIFLAAAIILTVLGACNPPQSTTGNAADSTSTRSDTSSAVVDTSGATQRDTSMHK